MPPGQESPWAAPPRAQRIARGLAVQDDARLEERLEEVEARLSERESLAGIAPARFTRVEDTWWHAQLTKVVEELAAFSDPESGLVDGIAPEHGWGVGRRLAWAREIRERTIDGEDAHRR